ncbi:hypothetical protein RFI_35476, partial [Reticulomyxa filosa]
VFFRQKKKLDWPKKHKVLFLLVSTYIHSQFNIVSFHFLKKKGTKKRPYAKLIEKNGTIEYGDIYAFPDKKNKDKENGNEKKNKKEEANVASNESNKEQEASVVTTENEKSQPQQIS